MNPTTAMTKAPYVMSEGELRYSLAYCEGETRRAAKDGPTLDYYEKRRREIEIEIERRRTNAPKNL